MPLRQPALELKRFIPSEVVRSRWPVAIGSGALLAMAFPNINIAGFAWIAPGLMLAAAAGTHGRRSFLLGYAAGLAHNLILLYWMALIPFAWHGIPIGPMAGWVALSAYLGLYPAVWVWVCVSLLPKGLGIATAAREKPLPGPAQTETPEPLSEGRKGGDEVAGTSGFSAATQVTVRDFAAGLLAAGWIRRMFWASSCAALWVALEMTVARLMSGFPWNLLGVSQWRMTPLIQIASVTGVYGISFLMVWTSVTLLCAAAAVVLESGNRHAWMREIIVPLFVVLGLCMWGVRTIRRPPPQGRELKIALVQPSIPQTLIWNSSDDWRRFEDLVKMSEQVLTNRPDLLIWPESAIPKMVRYDQDTFDAVTELARSNHVWMIIGSDDADVPPGSRNWDNATFYNSSFLVSQTGALVDTYRKRNLVIFGEYVPLSGVLPFLKYFTPIDGGFTPGHGTGEFPLPDLGTTASILVCFEDTFPGLARECIGPETGFLVNLTNDGWFGDSAEEWQHMTSALFRTVENGVPLVRSCNNGITCWIDAHGHLAQVFKDSTDSVYGAGTMVIKVPLPADGQIRTPTFYNRHGDEFGWGCVVYSIVALMVAAFQKRIGEESKV